MNTHPDALSRSSEAEQLQSNQPTLPDYPAIEVNHYSELAPYTFPELIDELLSLKRRVTVTANIIHAYDTEGGFSNWPELTIDLEALKYDIRLILANDSWNFSRGLCEYLQNPNNAEKIFSIFLEKIAALVEGYLNNHYAIVVDTTDSHCQFKVTKK